MGWNSSARPGSGIADIPAVKEEAISPKARILDSRESAFIEQWAKSYPYNRYRNYPLISTTQAARILTDEIVAPDPDADLLWAFEKTSPAGLIRVADLPWDSDIYRRRMGRITHICGDLPAPKIRNMLDSTGFDHLAVRVDASDLGSQRTLSRAGFFPVDSILTYLYHPASGEPPKPERSPKKRTYLYREYQSGDRDQLLRLTARMYARYPGRFHTDPSLRERNTDRYVRWAEKYLDGEADKIWVSDWNGVLVGYLAFRYDRRLYRCLGIGCYGSGLGASRGGDYHGLLRHALINTKGMPWQLAEYDTQIDNYPVHRIYQNLKLEYVRAEHTYHLHLS